MGEGGDTDFWDILAKLTVVGLPAAAVLSGVLAILAYLLQTRLYVAAGVAPVGFARLAFLPLVHVAGIGLPLVAIALCARTPRPGPRIAIAFIGFHIWLALYLATLLGVAWPALVATGRVGP